MLNAKKPVENVIRQIKASVFLCCLKRYVFKTPDEEAYSRSRLQRPSRAGSRGGDKYSGAYTAYPLKWEFSSAPYCKKSHNCRTARLPNLLPHTRNFTGR